MLKLIRAPAVLLVILLICSNVYALISENGDCDWDGANTCRMGPNRHYTTWQSFWDDIEALTGDITLLVDPTVYKETVYPADFTVDLNGYTIRVKPDYAGFYPTSSNGLTGPRFLCQYGTSNEFLYLDPTDVGKIIIEGINVVYSSGTCPTAFFYIDDGPTCTFNISRCIVKGDGSTANVEGIYQDASSTAPLYVINNYFINLEDGIYLAGSGSFIYNNTVYGCYSTGINAGTTAHRIVNNLVFATTNSTDFYALSGATGWNNLCEDSSCADANWAEGTESIELNGTTTAGMSYTDPGTNAHHTYLTAASTTDYVSCYDLSAYEVDLYDLADSVTDVQAKSYPISKLRVNWSAWRNYGSGTAKGRVRLKSGASYTSYGTENTFTSGTAVAYTDDFSTNPADSAAWEWTDLDALQCGLELYGGAGTASNATRYYITAYYNKGYGNKASKTGLQFTSTANSEYFLKASGSEDAVDDGIGNPSNSNLVAWYRFEPDVSLLADSTPNLRTLTAYPTAAAATNNSKVDHYAIHMLDTGTPQDGYYVINANLASDFPGKNTNATHDLTVTLWYRPGSNAAGAISAITGMWNAGTQDGEVWSVSKADTNKIQFGKGYSNGANREFTTHNSALTCDGAHWYFVAVSYDESNRNGLGAQYVRIRIWDDTAQVWLTDKTDDQAQNMDETTTDEAHFRINFQYYDGALYGLYDNDYDDLRVYKVALTPAEIDAVKEIKTQSDSFGRNRIDQFDIGAFEQIASRAYYIRDDGDNSKDALSYANAWDTFSPITNLEIVKALNPGDTVYLTMDDTWTDLLTIHAVGATGNPVTITRYNPSSATVNPIIDSYNGHGLKVDASYRTNIEYLTVNKSKNDNIFVTGSDQIAFSNITSTGCQMDAAETTDDGLNSNDGLVSYFCNNISISNSTFNWNNGGGIAPNNTDNITISNCTASYNGMVSQYPFAPGIFIGGNCNGVTINNCTTNYNSLRGIEILGGTWNGTTYTPGSTPVANLTISNCTAMGNGDGWGAWGDFVFAATSSQGTLARGDYVVQDLNANASIDCAVDACGYVHTVDSPHHQGQTGQYDNYIAVRKSSANSFTAAGTEKIYKDTYDSAIWVDPATTGAIDFSDGQPMTDCYDAGDNRYYLSCWSGVGHYLMTVATGTLSNNIVSGTVRRGGLTTEADGIYIAETSNAVIAHHNLSYDNDGSGIKIEAAGKTTANTLYNNTLVNNGSGETVDAQLTILDLEGENGNNADLTAKNNILSGDASNDALYVASQSYETITLDYNQYWSSGASGDNLISYEGTAYTNSSAQFDTYKSAKSQETNGQYGNPVLANPTSSEFSLASNSPCVDEGMDAASAIGCTGGSNCYDAYGTTMPIDGPDGDTTDEWDIGAYEWYTGIEYGKTTGTKKYDDRGWTETGWTGTGAITGDTQEGKISMDADEYMYGPVKDLGNSAVKFLSLSKTETDGSGTLCWRGSTTKFTASATDPDWAIYAAGNKNWRYVQIGTVNKSSSCVGLP